MVGTCIGRFIVFYRPKDVFGKSLSIIATVDSTAFQRQRLSRMRPEEYKILLSPLSGN